MLNRTEETFISSELFWGVIALCSLAASALSGFIFEQKLTATNQKVYLRGSNFSDTVVEKPRSNSETGQKHKPSIGNWLFRKNIEINGRLISEYGYSNFNNDHLKTSFSVSSAELAAYKNGYGYFQSEIDELKLWQKRALDEAYNNALKNHQSQEQLNRTGDAIKSDYRSRFRNFLTARGFTLLPGNILIADIPSIVRRNLGQMQPVALSLGKDAERLGYGSDEIISAALSMVQTAMLYENVPQLISGRQTGGVYPPMEAIARGRGDCDTKTALLASILMNWNKIRIIGIGLPNHYVMGVMRNPAKGDAFVEYKGLNYVLLEPSGPAWIPPGSIGGTTSLLLNSGKDITIEPVNIN